MQILLSDLLPLPSFALPGQEQEKPTVLAKQGSLAWRARRSGPQPSEAQLPQAVCEPQALLQFVDSSLHYCLALVRCDFGCLTLVLRASPPLVAAGGSLDRCEWEL